MKPYDSVLTKFIPVYINAFQTWPRHRSESLTSRRDENLISVDDQPSSFLDFANIIHDGKSLQNVLIIFILIFPCMTIIYQVKNDH